MVSPTSYECHKLLSLSFSCPFEPVKVNTQVSFLTRAPQRHCGTKPT